MRRHPLILVILAWVLSPAILPGQAALPPEANPRIPANLSDTTESATAGVAPAEVPAKRNPGRRFYASSRRHPITASDVSMREAVKSLGIDKHHFVRCELEDGSHAVGGIKNIHFAVFTISQGIMGSRQIKYSELKQPPEPVLAVGEHFTNGLKWTGVVAGTIAVSPLIVATLPLIFAGVLND